MKKDDKKTLNKNSSGFIPRKKIGDIIKDNLKTDN